MQNTDPRIRSLLRQASNVAAANKRAAAEQLYRQVIAEAPDVPEAWLGLAGVLSNPEEQAAAYRQVLQLDGENEAARAWLARVDAGISPLPANPNAETPQPVDPYAAARQYLQEATRRPTSSAVPSADGSPAVKTPAVKVPAVAAVPPAAPPSQVAEPAAALLVCANHPDRQTNLRCNRCEKPICTQCARLTPVGYRCKTCIREQEDVFYTAEPRHYFIAAAVALPLAILAAFLVSLIPFWFLLIFIAPAMGTLIGRLTFLAIGRRRGRYLPYLAAALVALSAVGLLLLGGNLLSLGIYGFLAVSSVYYQLK